MKKKRFIFTITALLVLLHVAVVSAQDAGIGTLNPWRLFGGGQNVIAPRTTSTTVVVGAQATSTDSRLQTPSLAVTGLSNCDTVDTNASGTLACGTDSAGGGVASSSPFTANLIPYVIDANTLQGDVDLRFETSTNMLQVFGIGSSTQLRSPSGTISVLKASTIDAPNKIGSGNSLILGANGSITYQPLRNSTSTGGSGLTIQLDPGGSTDYSGNTFNALNFLMQFAPLSGRPSIQGTQFDFSGMQGGFNTIYGFNMDATASLGITASSSYGYRYTNGQIGTLAADRVVGYYASLNDFETGGDWPRMYGFWLEDEFPTAFPGGTVSIDGAGIRIEEPSSNYTNGFKAAEFEGDVLVTDNEYVFWAANLSSSTSQRNAGMRWNTASSSFDIETGTTPRFAIAPTSTVFGRLVVQPTATSTTAGAVGGTIFGNTASYGNAAATQTSLASSTIATSTFVNNGDAFTFRAAGTFAATLATDKRLKVIISNGRGATSTIFDTGNIAATTAQDWEIEGICVRTGANAQKCTTKLNSSFASLAAFDDYASVAVTSTQGILVDLHGSGTNASDVVKEIWRGWFDPAP